MRLLHIRHDRWRRVAPGEDPDSDEALMRESLAGNICRCCTYPRIVRAARRAAALAASDGAGSVAEPRAGTPELPAPGRGPWDLLPLEERDYFDVLSDGMVVVLPDEQGGWRVVDEQRRVDPRRRGRASSRRSPARSMSGRTTEPPCPNWSPKSCVCPSSASGW